MTPPCIPIGSVIQLHTGTHVVVRECPEPIDEYSPKPRSVECLETDESGKHMYKNPIPSRDGPWWVTIHPGYQCELVVVGAVSNDTVLNLIKEAAQFERLHQ